MVSKPEVVGFRHEIMDVRRAMSSIQSVLSCDLATEIEKLSHDREQDDKVHLVVPATNFRQELVSALEAINRLTTQRPSIATMSDLFEVINDHIEVMSRLERELQRVQSVLSQHSEKISLCTIFLFSNGFESEQQVPSGSKQGTRKVSGLIHYRRPHDINGKAVMEGVR